MPRIALLIVDIDNTLFDWFDVWYTSFGAMLDAVLATTGIDRTVLLEEIRELHRRHATTEYTWLLHELPSIAMLPHVRRNEVIDAGRMAFSSAKRRTSRLYPHVLDTLARVKQSGSRIAGYTESQTFATSQRLHRFGLDGILDALYCRREHEAPRDLDLARLGNRPPDAYLPKTTRVYEMAAHRRKPDAQSLLDIVRDFGALPREVLYVGDNKVKDVYMAQQAGVHDAHAEYGQSLQRKGYDLLRAVSSWSDAEIEAERSVAGDVLPTVVLRSDLSEIFQHYTFCGPRESRGDTAAGACRTVNEANLPFNEV